MDRGVSSRQITEFQISMIGQKLKTFFENKTYHGMFASPAFVSSFPDSKRVPTCDWSQVKKP